MATVQRFEDLEVWQNSRELPKLVIGLVQRTDLKSNFKLRDQIMASSGSVMDNIAEGFERNGNLEFRQFLSIAKGSAGETRSQLYRIYDWDYITKEELDDLVSRCEAISKRISSFINYLNNSELKGSKFKK
ncbi:four helix bundle protein [Leeuwenhoekiella sp. A16]|uniref:four helix bundle protein n=1 Tax=unclassified Leeuwenhoekiella TaxID=2615029 RepID=UPI003A813696